MTADLFGPSWLFAQQTETLLNTTISNNVRLTAVHFDLDRERVMIVGRGISPGNAITQPIPLQLGREAPRGWLDLSYRLILDPRGLLTVRSSFVGLFADEECELCLCHVDYERHKADGYPEAHLQIHGESAALDRMNPPGREKRRLEKLHFPVGGRRYRPSLEDVIEFLIVEKLAEPHPGWQERLEETRRPFHELQLRAAMGQNIDLVRAFLAEVDAGKIQVR